MLNISILGASNSILHNGYVPRVEVALKQLGVETSISNYSVGATSCLRGVAPLLSGDVSNSDVIILEYSITDMPYLTDVGEAIWSESYEGLVRMALRSNPNSHVICLILGRSKAKFFERQKVMRKNIHKIAEKYNASVVDFDAELRALLPNHDEFEMCYKDVAHYQAPLPTSLCANSIAKVIYQRLRRKAQPIINSYNILDDASVIVFPDEYLHYGETQVFKNSRIVVPTLRLSLGDSIELPGELRPLGIEFVSSVDSCNILIKRGDSEQVIYGLHGKVKSKQFSFLWRFSHTQKDSWQDKVYGSWTITAVSSSESEPTIHSYGMIANDIKDEKAIYLSRLVCY